MLVLVGGREPCGTRRDDAAEGGGLRRLALVPLLGRGGGNRPAGGERVFWACGFGCGRSVGGCCLEVFGRGGGGIKREAASFATGSCDGFGVGLDIVLEGVGFDGDGGFAI